MAAGVQVGLDIARALAVFRRTCIARVKLHRVIASVDTMQMLSNMPYLLKNVRRMEQDTRSQELNCKRSTIRVRTTTQSNVNEVTIHVTS